MAKANRRAKEQAHRLRLVRERLHNYRSQSEFAKQLGIEYARYNNWERGIQTIPTEQAKKIVDATPGLTGDYIFWGYLTGLTLEIAKKLKNN